MKFLVKGTMMVMLCSIVIIGNGQSTVIGKQWPDLEFKGVLNYPKSEMKLSDFKGKPVIIHFWSRSCPPCIAAFPKLERLQEEFGKKIQIILVNDVDKVETEKFFVEKKYISRPKLPMATGQKDLFNQFRLLGDVWLDPERINRYMSTSYNITSKNIGDFLKGEDVSITQRRLLDDFNPEIPLIAEGNGRWLDSIKQYSYLFRNGFHIKESPNNYPEMRDHKHNRIFINYSTMVSLYKLAFNEYKKYDYDVVVEAKDSARFFRPEDDDLRDKWEKENHYTYDLMVPSDKLEKIYEFMRQDLERYFGVKGKIENRSVKCLVLEMTDKSEKLKTNGQKPRRSNYKDSTIFFYNVSFKTISDWVKEVAEVFCLLPFKDETGFNSNVDMIFNKDAILSGKREGIEKELNKYGLRLVEKMSEKIVLVLTDQY